MARRGKSQAKRSGRNGGGIPAWIWLGAGLLLGLALAAAVLMRDRLGPMFDGPQPNPGARPPAAAEEPVAQKPAEPAQRRPRYDFYTVLPEREVVVPDAEVSARARAEAQQPPPQTPSSQPAAAASERYLLQAGAFGDPRRADEVKAAIAFTGLVARVEPAATADGATVHRVMLGPFANAREVEAAKHKLDANGIPSVAVRVR